MATINEATRICKRIMLTNLLTNDYSIALTPLLSGKHGIGKSQIARKIAEDLNGVCITIEGGTLKEGEITGIPYQYRNDKGEVEFRFLPYYAVQRIQNAEKHMDASVNTEFNVKDLLDGIENQRTKANLGFEEKAELILSGKVTPVILFLDEINRTDSAVFRELMNIILTRTVNGYRFPWWVFIMAAINPSTQNSVYATNEMDPAQLDRFIKIKVRENADEWLQFAMKQNIDTSIIDFISKHQTILSVDDAGMEDEDKPKPSPRGWHMVDLVLKGKNRLDDFFSSKEKTYLKQDIRTIISSKIGSEASTMFFSSMKETVKLVTADEIFNNDGSKIDADVRERIKNQSTARNSVTSKSIVQYMEENIKSIRRDKNVLANVNSKIKEYIKLIDASSKFFFVTTISKAVSPERIHIFEYVFEAFDMDVLELLQANNMNAMKISGGC